MKKDSNLTIATILWIAVEVTLLAKLIMEQNQVFFGILVRVAVIVGIYGFFLERKLQLERVKKKFGLSDKYVPIFLVEGKEENAEEVYKAKVKGKVIVVFLYNKKKRVGLIRELYRSKDLREFSEIFKP